VLVDCVFTCVDWFVAWVFCLAFAGGVVVVPVAGVVVVVFAVGVVLEPEEPPPQNTDLNADCI